MPHTVAAPRVRRSFYNYKAKKVKLQGCYVARLLFAAYQRVDSVWLERLGTSWCAGTWSETPAWFRTKLPVASDASIALSFSNVSDAHQFFTSPLRSSDHLDYWANPPHGRNTDIGCK